MHDGPGQGRHGVMQHRRSTGWVGLVLAIITASAASGATAQDAETFFKGRTLQLVIGSAEGGGFDGAGRLAAKYLRQHLPGRPLIVAQNMPGASGIRVADFLHNVAARDGSTFGITQPSVFLNKLIDPAATYRPQDFVWIGRMASFRGWGAIWHGAPAQTIADARHTELVLGATGATGLGAIAGAALNQLSGTRFKIVRGYKASAELGVAMERGEIHVAGSTSWEYLNGRGWIAGRQAGLLYTIGLTRSTQSPDTPAIVELVRGERDRNVMKVIASTSEIGRALFAPPGVPPERVIALRRALDAVLASEEFMAEALRQSLDVEPLTGENLQSMVSELMAMPADVVALARSIMGPAGRQ